VLPWLPVVLALSANSPFVEGRVTGMLSNRASILAELPRGGAPPSVDGLVDPVRLEQMLTNLLDNAVKYSPNDAAISVSLGLDSEDNGDWAVIAVQDTGIGIPAADLPHIFERFHRGGNVLEHYQGTGIGLASVKQTAEEHGGTISIASVEGVGTTVTVRLPLAQPATMP